MNVRKNRISDVRAVKRIAARAPSLPLIPNVIAAPISRIRTLINQAAAAGLLRPGDLHRYQIAGRALVYGLSRMFIDGQFPSRGPDESVALEKSIAILDQFVAGIGA